MPAGSCPTVRALSGLGSTRRAKWGCPRPQPGSPGQIPAPAILAPPVLLTAYEWALGTSAHKLYFNLVGHEPVVLGRGRGRRDRAAPAPRSPALSHGRVLEE